MSILGDMKSDTHISPGRAALMLGVNPRTIARWADEGRFGPVVHTEAGHRRLSVDAVKAMVVAVAS
jgi:predicted site-specific integrase-resolvase